MSQVGSDLGWSARSSSLFGHTIELNRCILQLGNINRQTQSYLVGLDQVGMPGQELLSLNFL